MTNKNIRTYGLAITVTLLLATACSPEDSSFIRTPPQGPAPVETQGSALIGGSPNPSVNVSGGLIIPFSTSESETAAVTLDSPPGTTLGHAVAFNSLDTDPRHLTSDFSKYCKGFSYSAFSYVLNSSPFLTNAVFSGLRIPTPNGISMLVGDPAVALQDSGSSWTLYVSSMAVSDSLWSQYADEAGCISTSVVGEGGSVPLDQVCVNAVSIPKDGSRAHVTSGGWCTYAPATVGFNNYDGTTLYRQIYSGDLYLATWNILGGKPARVDVFKNGIQLPDPFPGHTITAHPLFPPSADVVPNLIGRDRDGFWIATGTPWTVSKITSGRLGGEPVLPNGTRIRQIGFTADIGQSFDGKHMFLFYTTTDTPKRLQGVKCSFYPTVTCADLPNSITPAGSNSILPAVVYVNHFPGGVYNNPWLSYWSDATSPSGNLQMFVSKVNVTDGSLTSYPLTGVNEAPCPNGDDWGDYDALTVGNNGGAFGQVPFLLRYLTDSTPGCTGGGNPQHVSVTLANPNL